MASVYYLFDDALQIADDIVKKYSQQDENLKENHYAATIIQRTYRSYIARKSYKKLIDAAIVLQKYIKGWLVRYHFVDFLQECWDEKCLKKYNMAATKIQAAWRGILVRREIDIRKIMKENRSDSECELTIESLLGQQFSREISIEIPKEPYPAHSDDVPLREDNLIRQRILDLMYNRHHLLSTTQTKGILTCNQELKEIEKVLRSISWRAYMTKLKKMSYKYQRCESDMKTRNMFKEKRMRREEDLLRLRDKSHDIKETCMGDFIDDDRKRFDLHSKLVQPPYERSLLCQGSYRKRETKIVRSEHPSRNISQTDFIFALKEIVKECNIPTYYADFWYKECIGHNFA